MAGLRAALWLQPDPPPILTLSARPGGFPRKAGFMRQAAWFPRR